ncbi:MAG: class I SAM-dependent methyltransferase [Acidiferrobacterales bacterium]
MDFRLDQSLTPKTPGAVLHRATRYDLLVWLVTLGQEQVFREKLVRLARLRPGESVLDVGCGTGTLAIAAKQCVGVTGTVYGIDASPEMIARADYKAKKAAVEVIFKIGAAQALSFPDAQFDAVLTTMMLHHLPSKGRQQLAREIRRVLKPGGRVFVADFAGSEREKKSFLAHFHRHGHVGLPKIISVLNEAGLNSVESGAVGFRDLQFVVATAQSDAKETPIAVERNIEVPGHPRMRPWMLFVGVASLVSGHVAALYYGLSHMALSAAAVVLGVIVLIVVGHLGLLGPRYALFRRRPRS